MRSFQYSIFKRATYASLILLIISISHATQANLITNGSFETGDFTGWSVAGNSSQSGVELDGVQLFNADPIFGNTFQNVRTGEFAGNALVCCNAADTPIERIELTQTISVETNTLYEIGFWLGNDSSNAFGLALRDDKVQLFVDGVGLLSVDFVQIAVGSGNADFSLISGTFNSGARSSVEVTYAIGGSGTARANASFDDLFVVESQMVSAPGSILLGIIGVVALITSRVHKQK